MRVRFTRSGRGQFLAALAYIRRDNHAAAMRFRKRVEKRLQHLCRFPEFGRILPEFPDSPFREVIVSPYRFFYHTKDRTVWVVAVWHGAQVPDVPEE